ncbi:haloacid dehalogenase type II [Williamsia sp. MIQD14]|uniref:haloacid dehalogenase type II n=1 Tax=Williamsia sp. MIQD14 TaxID=3425703 RepID=UPI003DA0E377
MRPTTQPPPKVLAFDTFGTVTDWHTGVSAVLAEQFPGVDASALARAWRRTYAPALAEVESGVRPWTLLDDIHRETLVSLLVDHVEGTPTNAAIDAAVHAWHTLPGWPDAVDGLRRLTSRFTVCALSNGNVALLSEMAKRNGFPWDVIGGADLWRHYKPAPEVYLGLAGLLQVQPGEVMMVATHADDLDAARALGLRTAYVERPREWGPETKSVTLNPLDDHHVGDIGELATALGC